MKKTVNSAESINAYKRLADDKADGGDLLGALGLYFTAHRYDPRDLGAIEGIADCYADMGLLELSNRFWFEYLSVAPKDRQGVAYEELAINFFYMDNLWASGYYFHLKVERDGFIAEEGLDEEIINFFSSPRINRDAYYLAYPYDLADYSYIAKNAKRAFSAGDIPTALKQYGKIPAECMSEETNSDYATALFLGGKDEESVKACKDSIARYGENVNAFCNLSSLYAARGDKEKAQYYYGRALAAQKGENSENYKIAACAIERGDHVTAKKCLSFIIKDRPYDDVMNFFYALALVNLGEYEKGFAAINVAVRIDPTDAVYGYYSELFSAIAADNSVADEYLPFEYVKALPRSAEREYKREISGLINGKKPLSAIKEEDLTVMLRRALRSEDKKTAKSAAFLLSTSPEKYREIMTAALIDGDVDDEIKNSIIYLLVVGGEKNRINAVLGNYYATIKPRKVVFEHKADGAAYMSAYALAVAKAVGWGIDDCAKIAFNMNLLYTDYAELIRFNGFGAETVSAVCFMLCDFPRINNAKSVCAAFGVDKSRAAEVEEFVKYVRATAPIKARERAEKAAKKDKTAKERNLD